MKNAIAAFAVGLLFAIGLGFSGMTQPHKVIGFLDVFGQWDPSLMFVMAGAVIVHFVTYRLIRKRNSPLLTTTWHVPTSRELTPALMIGSFLFGVGWALGGFCPGPAVTSLASFTPGPVVFVVSMLVGMWTFNMLNKKLKLQR
jgi:uncharacterized membrane protein YedE/YeeE